MPTCYCLTFSCCQPCEACAARLCSHTFIDPRTSGRMDCDVIDVNSAPDESGKECSYFQCLEVTYKCRLLGFSVLLTLADFAHM